MNFRTAFLGICLITTCSETLSASIDYSTVYRGDLKATIRSIADSYLQTKQIDLYGLPAKVQADYENSLAVIENQLYTTSWSQGSAYIPYNQVEMVIHDEIDNFIKIAKSVVPSSEIDKKINDFVCDLIHKNGLTKDEVKQNAAQEYESLFQRVKKRLNKIMSNHFCSYVYAGEIDTIVIEEFTPLVKRVKAKIKNATNTQSNSPWQDFWDLISGKNNQPTAPTAPTAPKKNYNHNDYDVIHSYEIDEKALEIANQVLIDNKYNPEEMPARVVSDYSDAVQKIITKAKSKMSYYSGIYAYEVKNIAIEELKPIIDKIKYKGEVCSICLDDIKSKETLGVLSCGHFFHEKCIEKSLEYSYKCPLCGTYVGEVEHTERVP